MPLPVCNRGYSSFEPDAEADIRSGNCHTCDIHSANSAFNCSNKKGPGSAPMKKPRRLAGARFRKEKCCYIFGLHFLAWASQTPPAFEQSACVFADATSAAKAGAVTASAKPKATIIERSFVMGTTPTLEGLTSGAQQTAVRYFGFEMRPGPGTKCWNRKLLWPSRRFAREVEETGEP